MLYKGIACISLIKFIKSHCGEDGYHRFLNALDEETKAFYSSSIIASEWYDINLQINAWKTLIREFGGGDEKIIFDFGQFIAETNLRGAYRVFIMFVSMDYLIRQCPTVTNSYFKGVKGHAKLLEPGKSLVSYVGFKKEHRLMQVNILGWILKACELVKAKNVKVEIVTSITDDKGVLEYLATWDV